MFFELFVHGRGNFLPQSTAQYYGTSYYFIERLNKDPGTSFYLNMFVEKTEWFALDKPNLRCDETNQGSDNSVPIRSSS